MRFWARDSLMALSRFLIAWKKVKALHIFHGRQSDLVNRVEFVAHCRTRIAIRDSAMKKITSLHFRTVGLLKAWIWVSAISLASWHTQPVKPVRKSQVAEATEGGNKCQMFLLNIGMWLLKCVWMLNLQQC